MGAAESKSPSSSKRGSSDSAKFGQPEARRSNSDDFFLLGGPDNSVTQHRSGHGSSPFSFTGKGTSTSKPTSTSLSAVPPSQKPSTEETIVKPEGFSTRPVYSSSSGSMSYNSTTTSSQAVPRAIHGPEASLVSGRSDNDHNSNAAKPSKQTLGNPFSDTTSYRPSAPFHFTESSAAVGSSGSRSDIFQPGPSRQPSQEPFFRYGNESTGGGLSNNELPSGGQLFSVGSSSSNFNKQPPQQKPVHHRHVDLKVYTPLQGTSDALFSNDRGERGGRSRGSHIKGHRGRGEGKRGGYRGRDDGDRGFRGRDDGDRGFRGRDDGDRGFRGRDDGDRGFRGRNDGDKGFRGRGDGNGEESRRRDDSDGGEFRGREGGGRGGSRGRGDGDRGGFRGRGDGDRGGFRGRGDGDRGGSRERGKGRVPYTGSVEETFEGKEYFSHEQKSSNEASSHRGMIRGNHRGRRHNGRRGGRGSHRIGNNVASSSANDGVGGSEIAVGDSARNFECPICMEDLAAPIYQCHNGHLVCCKCEKLIDKCAECREAMPENKIRNRAIEDLVSSMTNLKT